MDERRLIRGGIRPKEMQSFELPRNTNVLRMVMTPFWLMSIGIIGLGAASGWCAAVNIPLAV